MISTLLTQVTAAIGAATGIIGTALGARAYRRDRAFFRVRLGRHVAVVNHPDLSSSKRWGTITVLNAGRRPLFLQQVQLCLDGDEHAYPPVQPRPQTLEEGGEPVTAFFDIEGLTNDGYTVLRALAKDGRGICYYSPLRLRDRLRWMRHKKRSKGC